MKILSVKINNILSIEEANISFDDSGLTLITGWNYDVDRSNGAGKTAILNAIVFGLYDKVPRKVTATEILRRDAKSGFVEVVVKIGDDIYTVKRSRPKGVIYYKSSEIMTVTQEEWESKLKLNYDQFMKIAYCSQGAKDRFLSVNDADKKSFLLQLLNLEEFATSKKIADDKVKKFITELDSVKLKVSQASSKIDAYTESLVDENNVKDVISVNNEHISTLTKDLVHIQATPKPDLSKYQKIEDDLLSKKTDIAKARVKLEMLHDQYRRVSAKIKPFNQADTCNACGASLNNSSALIVHEKEIASLKEEAYLIKNQIDDLDSVLLKEKQIIELQFKLKEKKREESKEYDAANIKALELQSKILLKQQENKNLNVKLDNNLELQSKINKLIDVQSKLTNISSEINSKIDLYKTVSTMYSSTGAPAYVLDSIVDLFNQRVIEYINLLWSNLTYELKSYKENVKGEVSAKFSEILIMDGKEISIGSLSGGEYRALSLCIDFALIDVMERQFSIYVSPIILDEPFDGLDVQGKEIVVQLLEKIAIDRLVIIVDHSSELKSMFLKVISVNKRNGISAVSLTA